MNQAALGVRVNGRQEEELANQRAIKSQHGCDTSFTFGKFVLATRVTDVSLKT